MENKERVINRFYIENLFGYKNIDLKFNSTALVLIGENGYGKTTVLNSLYYLLKRDYQSLLRINFDKIGISIGNQDYPFSKDSIRSYCEYLQARRNNDTSIISYVRNNTTNEEWIFLKNNIQDKDKRNEIFNLLKKNPALVQLPPQLIYQHIFEHVEISKKYSLFEDFASNVDNLNIDVLYFPTYRRVEEELKNLIPNYQNRNNRPESITNFITNDTIIKFGMQDVDLRINKITDLIKSSSLKGSSIVNGSTINQLVHPQKQARKNIKFNEDEIRIILNRIGTVGDEEKKIILEEIASNDSALYQNSLLVFFLEQLLNVYNDQIKYDSLLKQFRDICNKYIVDKEFHYDEIAVTLKMYRKINGMVDIDDDRSFLRLSQLSSGEKQIISIFSRIYLEPDKHFIVLFDEPELSLSLYWQENLLPDIMNSGRCDFLLAVTHSPFIFNNELKDCAIGIKEFVSNGDE
ncbi:MAG: AAA family ATPase [Bacteroidales bacterium]|nr:AAA family ATPase [Bacteroidales bacterium]